MNNTQTLESCYNRVTVIPIASFGVHLYIERVPQVTFKGGELVNQKSPTPDYAKAYYFPLLWIAEGFMNKVMAHDIPSDWLPSEVGEELHRLYLGYLQEGTPEYESAISKGQLAPL